MTAQAKVSKYSGACEHTSTGGKNAKQKKTKKKTTLI